MKNRIWITASFLTVSLSSTLSYAVEIPDYDEPKIILGTVKTMSNLDELNLKTRNILLRRLKKDILDMPDKVVVPVFHELTDSEKNEYDNLWEEYLLKRRQDGKRGSVQKDLVELILLRRFISMTAINKTIEIAENVLESDKKIIIFTNFTDELTELANYFGKMCVVHNGKMSDKEKQNSVDQFQNNPNIKIFIGNIRSAGVGITLTEASVVIFNSFEWVPGWNEQAEDRCFRIGQKNDVTIYYNLFENTVSTKMWNIIKNKQQIIDKILASSKNDDEIIDRLINDSNDG
jgi:SWI/SNF-related matrix-associated actin-dependent regulator 1 of chromatin subfamily A